MALFGDATHLDTSGLCKEVGSTAFFASVEKDANASADRRVSTLLRQSEEEFTEYFDLTISAC